jgi:hypothetical protein
MEKTLQKDLNLHNYLKEHIEIIINNLLKNLDKIQEKQSITIIGKMLRKIIKGKDYLKYILNIKIFGNLVSLARSKNLFLSKEIFNIIFYIIESKKIDQNEVKIFINSQAKNLCEIVINHLKYLNNLNELENDDDNKCYFMKRESLVFIDKILKNYEKFNSLFTNNIEALKGIMIIINSNYNEVMIVGITILNYFFVDIEEKENKIKKILYVNKENFENFFKKNADVKEIEEQKFFILYELERLGNILFDDENKENNKDNNKDNKDNKEYKEKNENKDEGNDISNKEIKSNNNMKNNNNNPSVSKNNALFRSTKSNVVRKEKIEIDASKKEEKKDQNINVNHSQNINNFKLHKSVDKNGHLNYKNNKRGTFRIGKLNGKSTAKKK